MFIQISMTDTQQNYRTYKLQNGLVLAFQNTPTKTISAKLNVNYGALHEKEGEEGMAHFLEHCLVTGGNKKYNLSHADRIRGSFGYVNAQTNVARTSFLGGMLTEDLEKWLDFFSQQVFNPLFEESRVNGERARVLREIADDRSSSSYFIAGEFDRAFYREHPAGKNVLGKEEVVISTKIEKLKKFHERGFHPNNMDLLLVGGLPENLEQIIERYFAILPAGENMRAVFPQLPDLTEKIILHRSFKDLLNKERIENSSAQIGITSIACSESNKDTYALGILAHVLGGDASSRLFQVLGLEKGLAYDAGTRYKGNHNAMAIQTYAKVPAGRIEEAVLTIFEEMQKLKTEKIDEPYMDRIKKLVAYGVAKEVDSNENLLVSLESQLAGGKSPEEKLERYNKVTSDEVLEAAQRYLPDRETGKYILSIKDPLLKSD